MSEETLVACEQCAEARVEQDFISAKGCQTCGGKGYHRAHDSFHCNNCKASLQAFPDSGFAEQEGLVEASVSGGYMSRSLFDGSTYIFSLCEACLREMFDRFQTPPTIKGWLPGGAGQTYAEDQAAHRRRVWRRTSGPSERFAKRVCNFEEGCSLPAEFVRFQSGRMVPECVCKNHVSHANFPQATFVPVAYTEGVVYDNSESESYGENVLKLANGYLSSLTKPGVKLVFTFIPRCVREALSMGEGPEETETEVKPSLHLGGIWWPGTQIDLERDIDAAGIGLAEEFDMLLEHEFEGGTFFYGPSHLIKAFETNGAGKGFQGEFQYAQAEESTEA